MRAILIEPSDRFISETEVPEFTADIRRRFGGARLVRVATLPSGDGVYVVDSGDAHNSFTLGGAGPFHGLGLILGKHGHLGQLKGARTDFDALASIVTFWPIATGKYVIERVREDDGADGAAG